VWAIISAKPAGETAFEYGPKHGYSYLDISPGDPTKEMRPDSRLQPERDTPARIINLGDVRRRRRGRRSAPDRHYLAVVLLISLAAWGAWAAVVLTLQPAKLLTYLAFFSPLFIAVSGTLTLGHYAVDWQRGLMPDLAVCLRRGLLVGAILIGNLAAQSAHRWNIAIALASVVVAAGIDLALRYRDTLR
jgi:hypothetical protein